MSKSYSLGICLFNLITLNSNGNYHKHRSFPTSSLLTHIVK